jgi:hypothetical protein
VCLIHRTWPGKVIGDRLRLSASDVANFLACQHLTRLDLLRARRVLDPPYAFDVGFQDLVARGEAHERTALDQFLVQGREIVEIGFGPEADAAHATLEAIRVADLHVYHYNRYEPISVAHLTELHETRQAAAGRFATREDEVNDLFRLGVFVDLYRVVQQGIHAGVEGYSMKRLEPLCGYSRQVDLQEATRNLIAFETALEEATAQGADEPRRMVAGYNEDDCRATLALCDWLEERRTELAGRLDRDLPRPAVAEDAHAADNPDVARIKAALMAGVPAGRADPEAVGEGTAGRSDRLASARGQTGLVAVLLRPHAEPGRPDRRAGCAGRPDRWCCHRASEEVSRAAFLLPAAGTWVLPGRLHVRFRHQSVLVSFWAVDDEHGTIDLKIGNSYSGPLPAALVEGGPIGTRTQVQRLRDLGDRAARDGLNDQDAATALLMRLRPADGSLPVGCCAATVKQRPTQRSGLSPRYAIPICPPGTAWDREDIHPQPSRSWSAPAKGLLSALLPPRMRSSTT